MDYRNDEEFKKLIRKEINKKDRKSSFFSHLLAGILGAVIASFVVINAINVKGFKQTKTNKENNNITINASETNIESAVVKKSIDSVVGITTIAQETSQTIFGTQSGYVEGVGSGVIVSEDGYILTNSHVIENGQALKISVLLNDKDSDSVDADLIWNDSTLDLAVIKIDQKGLKPVEMADSDKVEVGNKVIAIGNPLGLDLQSTVTSGIISGLNRSVSLDTGASMDGLMQTDAAINSGNSGGALLNQNGELIGINTAKAGNSDGIGFAIPINTAKAVVDQIKETGSFESVYLGISGIGVDTIKSYFENNNMDLNTDHGVYVTDVYGDDSNLRKGDIVVAIDSKDVKDMADLKKILLNYRVGDTCKVTIIRDGKKINVDLKFTMNSSNIKEYTEGKTKEDNNEQNDKNIFDFLP
ncbi:MAG: trypsin-like peptidase domain-containing protein [Tissierellia bacterium]|nr:trypsin-like peptidase domain-containing protein [Tissierellia bacterium]